MFSILLVKEIRNNIMNLRFIVGMILCSVLTVVCVVILSNQYLQEFNDYNTQMMLQDEFLKNYAHTNRISNVSTPPRPPDTFRPLIMGIQTENRGYMSGFFEDPMPILFPHIDLIFIVTVIMSLLAMLFAYDAVSGEREDGTLRLIVSNRIKRPILILGKWIGGIISLFIPFILSLLVGALYIIIHPSIRWDSTVYAVFFLLILASMTFISSFYLLGLFMSSISKNSSASILNS
ncbi:MAG: ABC transporter permease subunit, partial [Candidatus Latescibacteria bacterium]|nr:ABC transporter permease subunit [Candidatus Latescibacterota bacterium]